MSKIGQFRAWPRTAERKGVSLDTYAFLINVF